MDAQKLLEALMTTVQPTLCADTCSVGACRPKCSLEVVDGLLSTPDAVTGEEMDLLLDFRSLLRARVDAEATLRMFCDLRRRMEQRHYLAFYRLRRWLENQMVAEILSPQSDEMTRVPVRLDFYCVEAVRRLCLCAAFQQNAASSMPRLRFRFIPLSQPYSSCPIESFDLVRG